MTYELAKELKEAGFPQGMSEYVYAHGDYIPRSNLVIVTKESEIYDDPTLSELIEACGEKFYQLKKEKAGWAALTVYETSDGLERILKLKGFNTPKEAVARLWLALNKK